jgi:zinc protease
VTQSKENPRFVLSAYHRAHVFGKHPYGNPINGTETSLAALTRDDVAAFYRDRYGADRTILAVTGDLGPDVATQVRRAFAAMPAAGKPPVVIEPPPRPQGRNVLLVNKNDTPQTWFMIGSLGPKWGDPDYPAVELVRTVFGGRFTSWLNTKLRIESGLTYGARYSIDRGRVAGLASISSYTATETTRQALDLALEQLARLHEEGIGEKDLASAKAYLKGQLPYDYETAEDLATVICELTYYGLDRSFVDEMFDRIDAVTVEDCRRVIEKDFGQDDLVFTTIGVESEVGELLAEYGELTVRQNDAAGFGVEPMSSLNR